MKEKFPYMIEISGFQVYFVSIPVISEKNKISSLAKENYITIKSNILQTTHFRK